MLLRLLCNLDDRLTTVAKIIRYWGKYGGFVGDIDNFNSYAFSLLVVHFLQTRSPPVLPSIQEIIKESGTYKGFLLHAFNYRNQGGVIFGVLNFLLFVI